MTHSWKRLITGLSIALGLAASGGTANAAYFQADYLGTNGGVSVGLVNTNGTGSYANYSGFAGQFLWEMMPTAFPPPNGNNVPGFTDANGFFTTFCIQWGQFIQDPTDFNSKPLAQVPDGGPNSPMGAARAARMQELFAERYGAGLMGTWSAGLAGATEKAAFQLAIWEILYEDGGSLNLSTGNHKASSGYGVGSAYAIADAWLATINGSFSNPNNWTAIGLEADLTKGGDAQDQVGVFQGDPGDFVEPVPAPPALILALVGIVPCLALRRRLRGQVA